MENTVPKNKPMTRDEWMAWLRESWAEAQGVAASCGKGLHQAQDHTPEQKPVGYVSGFYGGYCVIQPTDPATVLPVGMALYRAPTEWVGLTDEEVSEIIGKEIGFNSCFGPEESFARAIEAKLKEKNHG